MILKTGEKALAEGTQKDTIAHQLLAPESTWRPEINVADDSELDLDAPEELIESLGEEVGERTEALAEEFNERWGA